MNKLTIIIIYVLASYISAQGQEGVYLEYNATDKVTGKAFGTLKVYSSNGNSKTVLEHEYAGKLRLTETLYLKDASYLLFENKTFTKDTSKQAYEYKVQIVGADSVDGYACTKILLATYPGQQEDLTLWISNAIPNLPAYISSVINNIDIVKLNSALQRQNLSGIPVRIAHSSYTNSLQYDLRLAEIRKIDSAIFDIKDYHEAKFKSAEELKSDNKVSKEQYEMMKSEQLRIQKMMQQKDSTKKN